MSSKWGPGIRKWSESGSWNGLNKSRKFSRFYEEKKNAYSRPYGPRWGPGGWNRAIGGLKEILIIIISNIKYSYLMAGWNIDGSMFIPKWYFIRLKYQLIKQTSATRITSKWIKIWTTVSTSTWTITTRNLSPLIEQNRYIDRFSQWLNLPTTGIWMWTSSSS